MDNVDIGRNMLLPDRRTGNKNKKTAVLDSGTVCVSDNRARIFNRLRGKFGIRLERVGLFRTANECTRTNLTKFSWNVVRVEYVGIALRKSYVANPAKTPTITAANNLFVTKKNKCPKKHLFFQYKLT